MKFLLFLVGFISSRSLSISTEILNLLLETGVHNTFFFFLRAGKQLFILDTSFCDFDQSY